MKKKIREDIYRCEWCGDSFDNKKDLVDHRKNRHSDYGACDDMRKINRDIIANDRQFLKDCAEEELIPSPITEQEIRRIINSKLSDLSSMEILMMIDQGDEWREQTKLLDLSRKFGVMCRKNIETTEGTKIGYEWDYLRECVKEEEKIEGSIKDDKLVRVDNNKGAKRDVRKKGNHVKEKAKKSECANVKTS